MWSPRTGFGKVATLLVMLAGFLDAHLPWLIPVGLVALDTGIAFFISTGASRGRKHRYRLQHLVAIPTGLSLAAFGIALLESLHAVAQRSNSALALLLVAIVAYLALHACIAVTYGSQLTGRLERRFHGAVVLSMLALWFVIAAEKAARQ